MNEIKIDHMDIVVCTWSQKAWEEQASQHESKNPQNPMDDVVLGGTLSGSVEEKEKEVQKIKDEAQKEIQKAKDEALQTSAVMKTEFDGKSLIPG